MSSSSISGGTFDSLTPERTGLERIRPVDSCKPEKSPLPIIFLLDDTCADVESGSSDFWVMVTALKALKVKKYDVEPLLKSCGISSQ
nr:hypothetical protein [Tanacetum cinerariifolium]